MGIGQNIRRYRKEGDYTQKQLAGIIGVKASYISALERGVRRPGKKILPLLCDALGVDEMNILYGPRVDYGGLSPDYYIPPDATAGLTKKQILKVLNFIHKMKASGKRAVDTSIVVMRPMILMEPMSPIKLPSLAPHHEHHRSP